jgi:hypothetical protein
LIEKVLEGKEAKGNRDFHFDWDGFEIRRKDVIKIYLDNPLTND